MAIKDFGQRLLSRFVEIQGAQQATVLAAQAFTSLEVVARGRGPNAFGRNHLTEQQPVRSGLALSSCASEQAP